MRLVLQCAVCGTVHPVGASVCGTCAATGLQNLRLMFECLACFRLGIAPTCEVCNPKPKPSSFEVVEPVDPEGLARNWGVDARPGYEVVEPVATAAPPDGSTSDDFELTLAPEDDERVSPSDSGLDLLLDDDLPLTDPDPGPGAEPRR